jgi:predicted alpha-1,6-mannanase (GH76 family)
MKLIYFLAPFIFLTTTLSVQTDISEVETWENLFNGKNLDGWEVKCQPQDKNKTFWTVKNGVIECNSLGIPEHNYVWLMNEREFGDFDLHLNFQIFKSSPGNSGIQFRSRFDDSATARTGGWLNGPQVDIHPPAPFRAGLIYDETDGVNRWIFPSMKNWEIGEKDIPKTALQTKLFYADNDPNAWNTMEISCRGMKVKTFVNGNLATDFDATGILDDDIHKQKNVGTTGRIALQLHASDELQIRFKDIKINTVKSEDFTKKAIETLQKWYNPATGLWETTGWWNAANALTGIIRYTATTGDKTFEGVIENTFAKTKKIVAPASQDYPEQRTENFINEYYDDEGWWALAWVEAFDLTGKRKYLEMAKTIFEDMKGGWDDRCGGGILWKKGLLYKSAISNELFLLLATRLALRDSNREYYQNWANKEWDWFSQTGMLNDLPLVHDGVKEDCVAKGRHYTYNQGVILAGLVDLYKLDGKQEHVDLASKIATAAIQNMSTTDGILKGHPKQEDGADGVQFKGIFMRHLGYLYKQTKNPVFKEFLLKNAKAIEKSATETGSNLIGSQWEGPFDKADAGRQSSAIDALVSAIEIFK